MNSKLKYEKPAAEYICFRVEENLMNASYGPGGGLIEGGDSNDSVNGYSFDGSFDGSFNGSPE